MHLTLDKEKSKLVAQAYGVPVPKYQLFRTGDEALSLDLEFLLIVKPVREEASIGIYHDSVVTNEEELRRKTAHVVEYYWQPALAEQFIAEHEISVSF